jgi:hypothetical protein
MIDSYKEFSKNVIYTICKRYFNVNKSKIIHLIKYLQNAIFF